MGVRGLHVALCFAAASVSAACGDDEEQCVTGTSLLQAVPLLLETTHIPLEDKRWTQAVQEEGLDATSISEFGRSVPKFPRSVVTKLLALRGSTPKRHTYNFMGRLRGARDVLFAYGFAELSRRAWVIPFVLQNFSDHDFLKVTDPQKWFTDALGRYDHSSAERVRPHPKQPDSWYDLSYFAVLAASNFTLCPGGDTPWSVRTYEAALMGSICLVRDPAQDWDPTGSKAYTPEGRRHMARLWGMYRYQRLDDTPHVYREDIADFNAHVFIRYQTFIEGDNTPPPLGGERLGT